MEISQELESIVSYFKRLKNIRKYPNLCRVVDYEKLKLANVARAEEKERKLASRLRQGRPEELRDEVEKWQNEVDKFLPQSIFAALLAQVDERVSANQ